MDVLESELGSMAAGRDDFRPAVEYGVGVCGRYGGLLAEAHITPACPALVGRGALCDVPPHFRCRHPLRFELPDVLGERRFGLQLLPPERAHVGVEAGFEWALCQANIYARWESWG